MSPIDRVSLRAQAFTVLGVPPEASRDEIRKAYRKLAFSKHPDQHPEFAKEFALITEAYRTICENAEELGLTETPAPANEPVKPSRVSRPSVKAEESQFDAETIAECQAFLDNHDTDGTCHVASRLYRMGRSLTYFVAAPLAKGVNHVAVPTGMIADSRRVLPRIITFDAREAAGSMYEMPSDLCGQHFPGARSLRVRFGN